MSSNYKFSKQKQLSNGQWIKMYFNKSVDSNKIINWTVGLVIDDSKRKCNHWYLKNNSEPKQTGKCGLEGLYQALQWLLELEDNIKQHNKYTNRKRINHIYIGWADEKRHNVYRWLFRYGYDYGFFEYEMCLYKKIYL
jgi:hypothetical protein